MRNGPKLWSTILAALEPCTSFAIVAGGAVRDFMLDAQPKDIDVFVLMKDFSKIPEWLIPVDMSNDALSEEYEGLNYVAGLWRGELHGQRVEMIELADLVSGGTPEALVNAFDFGATRCWFANDGICTTVECQTDLDCNLYTLLIADRLERSVNRFARFKATPAGNKFKFSLGMMSLVEKQVLLEYVA